MKRKITKVLAMLMVLTMMIGLLPVTAFAADDTAYKLTVTISDETNQLSTTVLPKGGDGLVVTIATVVLAQKEALEEKFDSNLRDKVVAGLNVAVAQDKNEAAWTAFVEETMVGAEGDIAAIDSFTDTVGALELGKTYTLTYVSGETDYTITIKRENMSNAGGNVGGGSSAPSKPAASDRIFDDIGEDHAFVKEIEWAYNEGLVKGVTEDTYNSGDSISRQQLWMVLSRLDGVDAADMAAAKAWAVELGISDGTAPGAAVTRQQMVTIIYRFAQMKGYDTSAKADLSAFPDADKVSDYATDAMAWAVANGIVNGTLAGTMNPAGNTTRGQFAAILYRFADKFV